MPNRCRSNCFTFLTSGYAFIRLVGVFTLDRFKVVVLVLFVLCVALWLFAAGLFRVLSC